MLCFDRVAVALGKSVLRRRASCGLSPPQAVGLGAGICPGGPQLVPQGQFSSVPEPNNRGLSGRGGGGALEEGGPPPV